MFALISRTAASRRAVYISTRHMAKKSGKSANKTPNAINDTLFESKTESVEPAAAETKPNEPVEPKTTSEQPTPTLDPTHQPAAGVPSLDFSPPEPEEPQRTGARSSKGSLSSAEKKRRAMSRMFLSLLGVGFIAQTVYLGREWSEEELQAKKRTIETAPSSWWGRTRERFGDLFGYFSEPAWPELLPPPYPPPHQKPFTLLISIDDLLVTSTWDRKNGWRTAKRPGVDYFLAYISQFYEVVVFTTQPSYTAIPILDKLDRYNFFITHRLFRESTRSINGKIVKDLSYLNRDLSKVIMLDTDAEHCSTNPENSVIVPKWKGDPRDKGLIAMIPFLESIAIYKPPDVRPIIGAYQGKDIPIEYSKKEAEAKAKHVEEWKKKHPKGVGVSGGFLAGLLGVGGSSTQTAGDVPPTYLEQKRKEAQIQYREEQKYLEQHKEELEKLMKQEQDAMAAQGPANLWEVVTGAKPKSPEELAAQAAEGVKVPIEDAKSPEKK
ncbi:HAD-like domain-containing protein [Cyathus striatus]|nr:HAD-like domain-containing protein [Cyathus striatus]